jgi:hypothetical protein
LGVLFLDVKARSYSPIPPWVLMGVYPPFLTATLFPEKSSKEKNTRQELSDEWVEPNCVQEQLYSHCNHCKEAWIAWWE